MARTQAARRARIPGNRYETCIGCGLDWNVSLFAPKGWYICPQCEYRMRKERRYEQAQAQGFEREITDQLETLQELLQELQEQEEEYRDNMPENLQGSEKYERADEACSNLSDAYDSLQAAIDNITAAIEG